MASAAEQLLRYRMEKREERLAERFQDSESRRYAVRGQSKLATTTSIDEIETAAPQPYEMDDDRDPKWEGFFSEKTDCETLAYRPKSPNIDTSFDTPSSSRNDSVSAEAGGSCDNLSDSPRSSNFSSTTNVNPAQLTSKNSSLDRGGGRAARNPTGRLNNQETVGDWFTFHTEPVTVDMSPSGLGILNSYNGHSRFSTPPSPSSLSVSGETSSPRGIPPRLGHNTATSELISTISGAANIPEGPEDPLSPESCKTPQNSRNPSLNEETGGQGNAQLAQSGPSQGPRRITDRNYDWEAEYEQFVRESDESRLVQTDHNFTEGESIPLCAGELEGYIGEPIDSAQDLIKDDTSAGLGSAWPQPSTQGQTSKKPYPEPAKRDSQEDGEIAQETGSKKNFAATMRQVVPDIEREDIEETTPYESALQQSALQEETTVQPASRHESALSGQVYETSTDGSRLCAECISLDEPCSTESQPRQSLPEPTQEAREEIRTDSVEVEGGINTTERSDGPRANQAIVFGGDVGAANEKIGQHLYLAIQMLGALQPHSGNEAFEALNEEIQGACCEMDTLIPDIISGFRLVPSLLDASVSFTNTTLERMREAEVGWDRESSKVRAQRDKSSAWEKAHKEARSQVVAEQRKVADLEQKIGVRERQNKEKDILMEKKEQDCAEEQERVTLLKEKLKKSEEKCQAKDRTLRELGQRNIWTDNREQHGKLERGKVGVSGSELEVERRLEEELRMQEQRLAELEKTSSRISINGVPDQENRVQELEKGHVHLGSDLNRARLRLVAVEKENRLLRGNVERARQQLSAEAEIPTSGLTSSSNAEERSGGAAAPANQATSKSDNVASRIEVLELENKLLREGARRLKSGKFASNRSADSKGKGRVTTSTRIRAILDRLDVLQGLMKNPPRPSWAGQP